MSITIAGRTLVTWVQGKKTYMIAGMTLAVGIYQGIMGHPLPEVLAWVLGAAGLSTHRAAVGQVAAAAAEDRVALYETLEALRTTLDTVSTPAAPINYTVKSASTITEGK
jgi:hypothetical protein